MRGAVARYLERIWYRAEPPPAWLGLLERMYLAVMARRLRRPGEWPPLPVVVVGNLTAGGSGKTFVVQALAHALEDAGIRASIISRGYGGREPDEPLRVTSRTDARIAGDEAVMLARNTNLPVWVCRKRRRALEAAMAEGAEAVVSDDGLQHTDLPRSMEICVVDGRRRFGNGRLLPAGPLRQPIARLSEVDIIIVKQVPGSEAWSAGEYPLRLVPGRLIRLRDGHNLPATALVRDPVDAVAGIADPESFFHTLEHLGYEIRRHPMPDHHHFRAGDIDGLAGPVLVTAKDAVKLAVPGVRDDLWVMEVRPELPGTLITKVIEHVRGFEE